MIARIFKLLLLIYLGTGLVIYLYSVLFTDHQTTIWTVPLWWVVPSDLR